MLWLTLALIAGQDGATQASVDFPPSAPDAPAVASLQLPRDALSRLTSERCGSLLRQASPPNDTPAVGMRRLGEPSGEERVQMIYLLDQTVDGCRVLLVAADALPDADRAVGRNLADGRVRSDGSPRP